MLYGIEMGGGYVTLFGDGECRVLILFYYLLLSLAPYFLHEDGCQARANPL